MDKLPWDIRGLYLPRFLENRDYLAYALTCRSHLRLLDIESFWRERFRTEWSLTYLGSYPRSFFLKLKRNGSDYWRVYSLIVAERRFRPLINFLNERYSTGVVEFPPNDGNFFIIRWNNYLSVGVRCGEAVLTLVRSNIRIEIFFVTDLALDELNDALRQLIEYPILFRVRYLRRTFRKLFNRWRIWDCDYRKKSINFFWPGQWCYSESRRAPAVLVTVNEND